MLRTAEEQERLWKDILKPPPFAVAPHERGEPPAHPVGELFDKELSPEDWARRDTIVGEMFKRRLSDPVLQAHDIHVSFNTRVVPTKPPCEGQEGPVRTRSGG